MAIRVEGKPHIVLLRNGWVPSRPHRHWKAWMASETEGIMGGYLQTFKCDDYPRSWYSTYKEAGVRLVGIEFTD